MIVAFFKDGKYIDDCNQSNIPPKGDDVVIDGTQYTVKKVTWDYDEREVRIDLGDA